MVQHCFQSNVITYEEFDFNQSLILLLLPFSNSVQNRNACARFWNRLDRFVTDSRDFLSLRRYRKLP